MKPKIPLPPPLARLGGLALAVSISLGLASGPADAAANPVPTLLQKARQFAVFHDGGPDPATDQFSFNNSSLWGNLGNGRLSDANFSGGARLNGNCVADNSFTVSNTPCNFWVDVPPNPSPTGDRYYGVNSITDLDPTRADIEAAAAAIRALPPTQTLSLSNGMIINSSGPGAVNVIEIDSLVLGGTVTLKGGPTDYFFIEDTGDFKVNGASKSILLDGVTPSNVIIVVDGKAGSSGGGGWEGTLIVDGTTDGAWDNGDAYNSALYVLNTKLAFVSGWLFRWMPYTTYDYSDAPITYGTTYTAGTGTVVGTAARHKIIENAPFMGTVKPDDETDGNPTVGANGDDILGNPPVDDEDGIPTPITVSKGATGTVNVTVNNPSAANAFLKCWMDIDGTTGTFGSGDAAASYSPSSTIAPGTVNGTVQVTWSIPSNAPASTYLRCRISTNQNAIATAATTQLVFGQVAGPGQVIAAPVIDPDHNGLNSNDPAFPKGNDSGYAGNDSWPDGEVEDYPVTILQEPTDLGDLPQGTYNVTPPDATNYQYGTTLANNGPYHLIVTNGPKIGAAIDLEGDGQPTYGATGDDLNATGTPPADDEDGVFMGVYKNNDPNPKVTVYVTNPAGSAGPAFLSCWMDLNGNGQFNLPGERNTSLTLSGVPGTPVTSIPANTVNQPYEVGFGPMSLANGVTKTFLRCRTSTVQAQVGSPNGFAADGEVEDHQVSSSGSSGETDFDYGDAIDPGPGTGTGGPGVGTPFNYQTRSADNGPFHSTGVSEVWLGGLGVPSMPDPDSGLLNATNANNGTNSDDVVNTGKVDDEDGLNPAIALVTGPGNSLRVTVTNATTIPTVVACWIDMNRDGVFATTGTGAANGANGEVAWATVNPTGPSGTVVKLNFAGSVVDTPTNKGPTYVRCRVTTDWIPTNGIYGNPLGTQAITSVGPTLGGLGGDSGNGEVEDYSLEVYPPCVASPNPSALKVVTAPALTWNLSSDVTVPFKGIRFTVATGAGYPSPTSGGFTKAECSLMDNFNPANAKAGTTFISGINDPALTTGTQVSATGPTGTPPAPYSWTLATATTPLTVELHKLSTAGAAANCAFFDAGGNACTIDPWYISAIVLKKGKDTDLEVVETQTYNDVPVIDDYVEVTNGKPGVKKLDITVNGTIFRLSGLKDNEVRTLCITSALIPGISNTVTVEARGKKGGSAEIIGSPSAGRCSVKKK